MELKNSQFLQEFINHANSLELFDESEFARMYPEEFLQNEILEVYLEESPLKISEIEVAYQNKDYNRLYKALHYIKGSLSYVKTPKAFFEVSEIIEFLKVEDFTKVELLFSYVIAGLKEIEQHLKLYK